ncbi:hypothetical protein G7B40_024025 [Aetokthonos hydrillicola Thurmond2011]|jgi:hypothetical protein|uniref:Uncharacterized protein n=1 Tax=Aetokthonos hydrillicola Thurmond2011 TaxID=2712845 RepID=A0AAP5I9X9_9CYAN|nr:hypothetical protein [Aetokthonos hydrillicola]MBW4586914.1 hypothetical protein [Aetokthonos hydrillicola CCALA 1050]MDR9897611.1 hypothetical protein [Aetokthonos hydrillicola Thurmond2011]
MAACRSFEVAYEEFSGDHGVLTKALLQCLNPEQHPDGWVSNYNLSDFIKQQLKSSSQHPTFHNSGSDIILTGKRDESQASENWEDYLQIACNRLRYHPILKNPETEEAKQACVICQHYVWKE